MLNCIHLKFSKLDAECGSMYSDQFFEAMHAVCRAYIISSPTAAVQLLDEKGT